MRDNLKRRSWTHQGQAVRENDCSLNPLSFGVAPILQRMRRSHLPEIRNYYPPILVLYQTNNWAYSKPEIALTRAHYLS
jgi:hypothetical protein